MVGTLVNWIVGCEPEGDTCFWHDSIEISPASTNNTDISLRVPGDSGPRLMKLYFTLTPNIVPQLSYTSLAFVLTVTIRGGPTEYGLVSTRTLRQSSISYGPSYHFSASVGD